MNGFAGKWNVFWTYFAIKVGFFRISCVLGWLCKISFKLRFQPFFITVMLCAFNLVESMSQKHIYIEIKRTPNIADRYSRSLLCLFYFTLSLSRSYFIFFSLISFSFFIPLLSHSTCIFFSFSSLLLAISFFLSIYLMIALINMKKLKYFQLFTFNFSSHFCGKLIFTL